MQKNIVNTKQVCKLLLIIVIFAISFNVSKSQKLDSPLEPVQRIVKDWELGFFVGFGANYSSGAYNPECPDCVFDDNSKFGWTIGLKSDREITRSFYFGTNLIFDNQSATGSFRRFEDVPLQRTDGSTMTVPIEFRHTLNLDLYSIGLAPNAVLRINDWLDLRLGLFADYLFSSNVSHVKELLTSSVLLPDGEKVKVSIPNSTDNKATIEDQSIPGLNALQFGIYPQINFNIPISEDDDFFIGGYMKVPLTDLSSLQPGYKHYSWRFILGFSFDLYQDHQETFKVQKN